MKRRTLFVALVILAGTVAWLLTRALREHPDAKVSVALLGYTNDVAGNPVFGYADTSNVVHSLTPVGADGTVSNDCVDLPAAFC